MEERDICTSWVVSTELEGAVGLILVPKKLETLEHMLQGKGEFLSVTERGPGMG